MKCYQIYQTAIRCDDDVFSVDTIQYENGLWLVFEWLETTSSGVYRPARIIRCDHLAHVVSDIPLFDYALNVTLPKALLDGLATEGFEVHESPPDIFVSRQNDELH